MYFNKYDQKNEWKTHKKIEILFGVKVPQVRVFLPKSQIPCGHTDF